MSEERLATARYVSGTRDRAAVGIVVADAHGVIRQMNDELLRIFKCAGGADAAADVSEDHRRFISDQLVPVLTSARASQATAASRCKYAAPTVCRAECPHDVSILRDPVRILSGPPRRVGRPFAPRERYARFHPYACGRGYYAVSSCEQLAYLTRILLETSSGEGGGRSRRRDYSGLCSFLRDSPDRMSSSALR